MDGRRRRKTRQGQVRCYLSAPWTAVLCSPTVDKRKEAGRQAGAVKAKAEVVLHETLDAFVRVGLSLPRGFSFYGRAMAVAVAAVVTAATAAKTATAMAADRNA